MIQSKDQKFKMLMKVSNEFSHTLNWCQALKLIFAKKK